MKGIVYRIFFIAKYKLFFVTQIVNRLRIIKNVAGFLKIHKICAYGVPTVNFDER